MESEAPVETNEDQRAKDRRRIVALILSLFAIAIVGAVAVPATANTSEPSDGDRSARTATPTTVQPARQRPDVADQPTEEQIRAVYDEAVGCIKAAGITVTYSELIITKYDVSTTFALTGANGHGLSVEEARADEQCRSQLGDIGVAWTNASNFPYEELQKALDDCLERRGTSSDADAGRRADSGEAYGHCMGEARATVLGTRPPKKQP